MSHRLPTPQGKGQMNLLGGQQAKSPYATTRTNVLFPLDIAQMFCYNLG